MPNLSSFVQKYSPSSHHVQTVAGIVAWNVVGSVVANSNLRAPRKEVWDRDSRNVGLLKKLNSLGFCFAPHNWQWKKNPRMHTAQQWNKGPWDILQECYTFNTQEAGAVCTHNVNWKMEQLLHVYIIGVTCLLCITWWTSKSIRLNSLCREARSVLLLASLWLVSVACFLGSVCGQSLE